jgi:XTP/dITP diphosphohydrolase
MRSFDMNKPITLIFATNNQHKLKEVSAICPEWLNIESLDEIGFSDDIPEPYDTLEANSLTKAETIYNTFHRNCFAEDTGLEVEALGHAPGVLSARYAGEGKDPEENIDLLLKNLEGLENRQARFRTVLTLILDGKTHQFEGIVNGTILHQRAGRSGFGYDPVFSADGNDLSFAQIPEKEKNKISHRRMAIEALIRFLKGQ